MSMEARSELIISRTYAREKEDGTKETWAEIVERVKGHQRWLWEEAQNKPLNFAQEQELTELAQLMLEKKISMSGRTLWLGGTEVAKKRAASQFNCFSGDTLYMTEGGLKSFKDTVGTTQKVLAGDGEWREAEIKSFGTQSLNKISFRPQFGNMSKTQHRIVVKATPDHRWIKVGGEETTFLTLRDKVPFNGAEEPEFCAESFVRGFGFGDGTVDVKNQARIRLCGDKAKYLPVFESLGNCKVYWCPSNNGDPLVVYDKGFLSDWKKVPKKPSYHWFQGYYFADGHLSPVQPGISTQDTAAAEYIMDNSAYGGMLVTGRNYLTNDTNYGPRAAPLQRIGVRDSGNFCVTDIEPTDEEEVFCAVEPVTHSFTLVGGILTGNCSFTRVETVHDVVDGLWLLMQGCGLGFTPVVGSLSGFSWKIPEFDVIRSEKKLEGWPENRGRETNKAWTDGDTWTLSIGDSAEAWAKGIGKLLAFKGRVKKIVIDLSEIRPSGIRLKGYGWISSGDETLHEALEAIFMLLNNAAGKLLSRIEILDLMNWLGTVLSSRRSAEIALFSVDEPEWEEFAVAKREYWINNKQRAQSNNSLLFNRKPAREQLEHIFSLMLEGGGCEPGFINGETARKRAPWFAGINPCAN